MSRYIVFLYGSLTAIMVGIGVLVVVLCSLLGTAYVVSDGGLLIRVLRIIGGPKVVEPSKVRSIRRVRIPFGVKLFGASSHGGYYVPGLGRTFMAITNFSDGVLIGTEDGRYIITPSSPDEFIKAVEPST